MDRLDGTWLENGVHEPEPLPGYYAAKEGDKFLIKTLYTSFFSNVIYVRHILQDGEPEESYFYSFGPFPFANFVSFDNGATCFFRYLDVKEITHKDGSVKRIIIAMAASVPSAYSNNAKGDEFFKLIKNLNFKQIWHCEEDF